MSIVMTAAFWGVIGIAFITDVRKGMISNWLTGSSFAGGVLYHSITGGAESQGWLWSCAGAAAGFLPLLIVYIFGGIGAGDVKLFGALGAWIGAAMVAELMMFSILYAGALGAVLLIVNKSFAKRFSAIWVTVVCSGVPGKSGWFQWAKSGKSFPFMLAVAPAAVTLWLIGTNV